MMSGMYMSFQSRSRILYLMIMSLISSTSGPLPPLELAV